MSLDFGRCPGSAQVALDTALCSRCGLCLRVCKEGPLVQSEPHGPLRVDLTRGFGCIGCGQCVAVCPRGALSVAGRDFGPDDVIPLPPRENRATWEQLHNLSLARRSIRDYRDTPVSREDLDRILQTASTAPMGISPSEVHVSVFPTRESVQGLTTDLLGAARIWRKYWLHPLSLRLLYPWLGREGYHTMKDFVRPVIDAYLEADARGDDLWFYGAPCALYFSGSTCSDDADPTIAATYAMLAAESLGLGTIMLGFPSYFFRYNARLREKYGIPKHRTGLMLALGHPTVTYSHAIRRRFAGVTYP
ncbi:MAG TPA: nitroreductase family protein [Candidatus Sumerlaeota bacterium]|nr:nitroreductase family protein [Candidatus Sumerlaeota bacterium]